MEPKLFTITIQLVIINALLILGTCSMAADSKVTIEHRVIEKDNKPHVQLKIEYPYIKGSSAFNKLIKEDIVDQCFFQGDYLEDDFRSEHVTDEGQCPMEYCHELSLRYQIHYQKNGIVSIGFDGYAWSEGSLHGIPWTKTINYDLNRNKKVILSDIYRLDKLAAISNEKLKSWGCTLSPVEPVTSDFSNWNLTEKGLKITWGVYHLGGYPCGSPLVFISHDELEGATVVR